MIAFYIFKRNFLKGVFIMLRTHNLNELRESNLFFLLFFTIIKILDILNNSDIIVMLNIKRL